MCFAMTLPTKKSSAYEIYNGKEKRAWDREREEEEEGAADWRDVAGVVLKNRETLWDF